MNMSVWLWEFDLLCTYSWFILRGQDFANKQKSFAYNQTMPVYHRLSDGVIIIYSWVQFFVRFAKCKPCENNCYIYIIIYGTHTISLRNFWSVRLEVHCHGFRKNTVTVSTTLAVLNLFLSCSLIAAAGKQLTGQLILYAWHGNILRVWVSVRKFSTGGAKAWYESRISTN